MEVRGICPQMGVIELSWFKKIAQGHIANPWGSQELNFRNIFFKPSDIFLSTERNPLTVEAINRILISGTYKKAERGNLVIDKT